MSLRRAVYHLLLFCALASLAVAGVAMASDYHGQVTFGGLPVPGSSVTVTATQGSKKAVAISDDQGLFSFTDLADGTWSIDIEMTGFAPIKQDIAVAPNAAAATFEMKLLTLDQMRAAAKPVVVEAAPVVAATTPAPADNAPGTAGTTPAAAPGKAAAAKTGTAAKTQAAAGAAPDAPAPQPAPDHLHITHRTEDLACD